MQNREQANQVANALLIGDKQELALKYAKRANEIPQTYRSLKLMALPTQSKHNQRHKQRHKQRGGIELFSQLKNSKQKCLVDHALS